MPTSNTGAPYLGQNVAEPEIPHNEALDVLDAAIAGQLYIDMIVNTDYSLDNTSLTYPQEWQHGILIVNPVAHTQVTNIIAPAGSTMKYVVNNSSGGGFDVVIQQGGVGVSVPDGAIYQVYCDGVDVRRIT